MQLKLVLAKEELEFRDAWKIYNRTFGRKRTFLEFEKRFCHNGNKIYIIISDNNKVGFGMISSRNELGYFILPEFQKKGFGKRAIKQIMKKEKRNYYWAITDFNNEKSKKFAQSIGMVPSSLVYSIDWK